MGEGELTGFRASGISVESGGVILFRSFKSGGEGVECVYLKNMKSGAIEVKTTYVLNVEWRDVFPRHDYRWVNKPDVRVSNCYRGFESDTANACREQPICL